MMDEVSCETGRTQFKTVSSNWTKMELEVDETYRSCLGISGNFCIPRPSARGVSGRKPQNIKPFSNS